jgi:DNA-binding CsgD family transcriptional regulator
VADLPPGAVEIAVRVGRIVAAPGSIEERARAVLAPLRRLVPFRAACVSMLGPSGGQLLANDGYDDAVSAYIESPQSVDEIEMLGLNRTRAPMRLPDLPVPPEQIPGWVAYLEPAGFKGGLAVGLFTGDGRHLGILGMNTDDPAHPTDAARDFIGRLASMIANAVDPLRSVAEAARIVRDAFAGIVLTASKTGLPLPGLPGHSMLSDGSDVLLVVNERIASGRAYATFLCPMGEIDAPHDRVKITLLSVPPRPPQFLTAAVLMSPSGNTCGLTSRELQVLGLLVEGWANRRMAQSLFVTERTVASHVEHILAKLAAPSRTLAAVRALRQGLYVPRPLNGVTLG